CGRAEEGHRCSIGIACDCRREYGVLDAEVSADINRSRPRHAAVLTGRDEHMIVGIVAVRNFADPGEVDGVVAGDRDRWIEYAGDRRQTAGYLSYSPCCS